MTIIILIVTFVPLFLLASLAFIRQPDFPRLLLGALVYGLAIFFMWMVFPWHIVSIWYKYLMVPLYIAAVYLGYRRIRRPEKTPPAWLTVLNTVINLALIIFFAGLSWKSFEGYATPDGAISLASPLRDAKFLVSNGGGSPFINGHARVRPQNHALDILGLNVMGGRAGFFSDSSNLESYEIFGMPVYAPCSGHVLVAEDGLEDMIPPAADRKNLAGNHVLIACHDAEVLLAHLKKGSVMVSAGQQVNDQAVVGQVGNSGNTSEPHLHIHAERGGDPLTILNGKAVPFTIDGQYLVRGSIIR